MGKKTIYIRDEDEEVFNKAMDTLGDGEGMGSIIVTALKEKMQNMNELENEAYELSMLVETGLNRYVERALNHYLQIFPGSALEKAEIMIMVIRQEDPEYFTLKGETGSQILKAMWADDPTWFEKGKELVKQGWSEHERRQKEGKKKLMETLGIMSSEKPTKSKKEQPKQTKTKRKQKQEKGG
jgi:hypothetical protein